MRFRWLEMVGTKGYCLVCLKYASGHKGFTHCDKACQDQHRGTQGHQSAAKEYEKYETLREAYNTERNASKAEEAAINASKEAADNLLIAPTALQALALRAQREALAELNGKRCLFNLRLKLFFFPALHFFNFHYLDITLHCVPFRRTFISYQMTGCGPRFEKIERNI